MPVSTATAARSSRPRAVVLPVRSLSLEIAPEAKDKLAANPAFNRDALLEVLGQTLRSRRVLISDDPAVTGTAMVSIQDLQAHATSNAVVFGYLPGAGTLSTLTRIAEGEGPERARFSIVASSPLRAPASDTAAFALQPLYRILADRLADELAGTPGRTDDSLRGDVPR